MRCTDDDEPLSLALRTYGECGSTVLAISRQLVRPGDVVLQIGAHSGYTAIGLSSLVGPDGAVIAVELNAKLQETLVFNVEKTGCSNVICQSSIPAQILQQHSTDLGENEEEFGTKYARGNFSDSALIPRCRLVYVHTGESAAIPLIQGWLQQARPALLVACDDTDAAAALWFRFQADCDVYLAPGPLYNRKNFRREVRNIFGDAHQPHLLLLPKGGGHGYRAPVDVGLIHIESVSELVILHAKLPKFLPAFSIETRHPPQSVCELQAEETRRSLRELRLSRRLEEVEAKLSAALDEISSKERQLSSLQGDLRALLDSKAWRATAPLRRLLDTAKGRH